MKIKDYYDLEFADRLAGIIAADCPHFNRVAYTAAIPSDYLNREMLARQDGLADAIEAGLGTNYLDNLKTFRAMLGDELATTAGMFTKGWWLWPIGRYVERHGTQHPAKTLSFLHEFTRRQTGEFAVRPLLIAFPRQMMETFLAWSRDDNVHVRRLASEGMRISLPWAKKTTAALSEFEIYQQILTTLKDDPHRFVQKSVGNNLNDLYKVGPSQAQGIVDSWHAADLTESARWVIRHGQRTMAKREAMQR